MDRLLLNGLIRKSFWSKYNLCLSLNNNREVVTLKRIRLSGIVLQCVGGGLQEIISAVIENQGC